MSVQTKSKRNMWIAIGAGVIIIAAIVVLLVSQGLNQPESSTQAGEIDYSQGDGNLVPGQDAEITSENVIVYVPAQAIEAQGSLLITAREMDFLPLIGDPNWVHIQAVNVEYLDTEGVVHTFAQFPHPIEVCFQVTQDVWDTYTDLPENFLVQTYVEADTKWETLPMVTHTEQREICGKTTHLSLFALAQKIEAPVPVTGATEEPTEGPYEP